MAEEKAYMTVGQLKELLKNVPDETAVLVQGWDDDWYMGLLTEILPGLLYLSKPAESLGTAGPIRFNFQRDDEPLGRPIEDVIEVVRAVNLYGAANA